MLRILHLSSCDRDCQTRQGLALLSRGLWAGFDLTHRQIRRGGDYRNVVSAVLSLRHASDGFDVVHAWGIGALAAAVMGMRGGGAVVYSPVSPAGRREAGWLRAMSSARAIEVICPTATMRRQFIERGVAMDRCHLVRPAVDFSAVRGRKDAALRQRLGIGERDVVLLAPGQSTESTGHRLALWAASILNVLDPRYRLLIEGTGRGLDKLRRFAINLGRKDLLVAASGQETGELTAAADAVLWAAAEGAPVLPICVSMAAGLPIVSIVTSTSAELLEDRHNALLVGEASPRLLARRVLDLFEDAQLRWRLADAARSEAFEFFSPSRFVRQHQAVYGPAAAGERVEIPQEMPGAGSRFMGRA